MLCLSVCVYTGYGQTSAEITPGELAEKPLNKNIFGFNFANFFRYALVNFPKGNNTDPCPRASGVNPNVRDAFLDLNPQVVRFPGGTLANFYHYEPGSPGYGIKEAEITGSDGIDINQGFWDGTRSTFEDDKCFERNALEEYVDMMEDYYGDQPHPKVIYVANLLQHFNKTDGTILPGNSSFETMYSETRNAISRLLETDNAVIGIELGNELYFSSYHALMVANFDAYDEEGDEIYEYGDYRDEYLIIAAAYAERLKDDFPNIKRGVPVDGIHNTAAGANPQSWGNALMSIADPYFQSLVIHPYLAPDFTSRDLLVDCDISERPCFNWEIADYFTEANGLDGPNTDNIPSHEYDDIIDHYDAYREDHPGMELWNTEWNLIRWVEYNYYHDFTNGNYVFRMLNHALHRPRDTVTVATYHLVMGPSHVLLNEEANKRHMLYTGRGDFPDGDLDFYHEYYAQQFVSEIITDRNYPGTSEGQSFPTQVKAQAASWNLMNVNNWDLDNINFYFYKRDFTGNVPWLKSNYGGTHYLYFSNTDNEDLTIDLQQIFPQYYQLLGPYFSKVTAHFDDVNSLGNEIPMIYEEELTASTWQVPARSFGYIEAEVDRCNLCTGQGCPEEMSFTISDEQMIQGQKVVFWVQGDKFSEILLDGEKLTGYLSNVTQEPKSQNGDTYSLNGNGEIEIEMLVDFPLGKHQLCYVTSSNPDCAETICYEINVCSPALFYNGKNEKTTIAHEGAYAFEAEPFTLEAGIQSMSKKRKDMVILRNSGGGKSEDQFSLGLKKGKLYFEVESDGTSTLIFDKDGEDLRNGTCHRVAVTRNAQNEIGLYVDGRQVEKGQLKKGTQVPNGSTLILGNTERRKEKQDFVGAIDELRIWNTARTEEEIRRYAKLMMDFHADGLVGYWRFDSMTRGKIFDDTGQGASALPGGKPKPQKIDPQVYYPCCKGKSSIKVRRK